MAIEILLGALYLFIFGLCCAGLIGWALVINSKLKGRPILPLAPRRPVPWGLPAILVLIGLWLLAAPLVSEVLVKADVLEPPQRNAAGQIIEFPVAWMVVGAAVQLTIILGFAAILLSTRQARPADLGISTNRLGRHVAIGLAGTILLLPVTYVVQAIATQFIDYSHPLLKLFEDGANWRLFATAAAIAVVAAPIGEELVFRVYLQGWLENLSVRHQRQRHLLESNEDRTPDADRASPDASDREGNPFHDPAPSAVVAAQPESGGVEEIRPGYWPIFVSSGLFAVVHLGQGPAPVSLFFLALGLGFLYRQTHSFWPPFIVHLSLNGITMLGTFLTTMIPEDSPLAPPDPSELPTAVVPCEEITLPTPRLGSNGYGFARR